VDKISIYDTIGPGIPGGDPQLIGPGGAIQAPQIDAACAGNNRSMPAGVGENLGMLFPFGGIHPRINRAQVGDSLKSISGFSRYLIDGIGLAGAAAGKGGICRIHNSGVAAFQVYAHLLPAGFVFTLAAKALLLAASRIGLSPTWQFLFRT
jgi:hypothetical protein